MERERSAEHTRKIGADLRLSPAARLGCLVVGLFAIAALILSILAPLQVLATLLTGWITYPLRVIPEVSINAEMWICGIGALVLALLVGHRFLKWLAAKHPALPSPWSFRGTLALTTLLLLLFGASIAMTGIVHQTAWLLRSDEPFLADGGFTSLRRTILAENMNNALQVKYALDGFATDHDGNYPPNLEALVAAGEIRIDAFRRLRLWRPANEGPGEPWLYLGAGAKVTDDVSLPILVQPRPDEDGRVIVVQLDGSAKAIREEQLPEEVAALLRP